MRAPRAQIEQALHQQHTKANNRRSAGVTRRVTEPVLHSQHHQLNPPSASLSPSMLDAVQNRAPTLLPSINGHNRHLEHQARESVSVSYPSLAGTTRDVKRATTLPNHIRTTSSREANNSRAVPHPLGHGNGLNVFLQHSLEILLSGTRSADLNDCVPTSDDHAVGLRPDRDRPVTSNISAQIPVPGFFADDNRTKLVRSPESLDLGAVGADSRHEDPEASSRLGSLAPVRYTCHMRTHGSSLRTDAGRASALSKMRGVAFSLLSSHRVVLTGPPGIGYDKAASDLQRPR